MLIYNLISKLNFILIFYIMSILFFFNCGDIRQNFLGSFSFHAIDESGLSNIEQKWYSPKIFQKKKMPIIFYENESLWYCYQPYKPSHTTIYIISLAQKNNSWLEVDVQTQNLIKNKNALTGRLGDLQQGNYLLQVFAESKLLNKIQFEILPNQKELTIDYDNLEIIQNQDIEDDINFYSR